jgi:hypothetical protein
LRGSHEFERAVIALAGICAIASFKLYPGVNQSAPEPFFTGIWSLTELPALKTAGAFRQLIFEDLKEMS